MGSRSGLGLGRGCNSGGTAALLRQHVEQVLALLLRRAGEVGGGDRTNARKRRRRAVRRMVACAVRGWGVGGTGGRGTVGCISDSGRSSHCCTASTQKMKSSSPAPRDRARAQQRPSLSAQSQVGGGALGRWSRSSAFGGKGLPSRNLCRQVTSAARRSSGQKSNSVLMDILPSRG